MRLQFGMIFLLFFGFGCNDKVQIKRFYSYPESNQISAFKNSDQRPELYISVVGNLSEQIYPVSEQRGESAPTMIPSTIKVGGLSYLSSYLTTLRAKIEKEEHTELLSIAAGATIPTEISSNKKLEIITRSLNHLNLDFLHLEFNEAKWLQAQSTEQEGIPVMVNSNIFDIKSGKPIEKGSTLPYFIKRVGTTHVGIIAISSYDFLSAQQKAELNGLYYQDPLTAILRTKNLLKAKNVEIVILLYQGKLNCTENIQSTPISFNKLKSLKCLEDKKIELHKILSKLPPRTLDLIISSKSHISSAKIMGIPILGIPNSNDFISLTKLTINDEKHEIVAKESYTLAPLKICHDIFAGLEDCVLNAPTPDMNTKRFDYLKNTAFGLIPAKFLGNQIKADPLIEKIINGK